MEQPRFGGVALRPLSHNSGEGKCEESNMDEMEKQNAEKFGSPQIRNDGNEGEQEKSPEATQDEGNEGEQEKSPEATQDEGNEGEQEKSSEATQDPSVQKVLDILQELEVSVHLEEHRLKQGRQKEAGSSNSTSNQEVYCKNLLLKDKKGQAYLVICDENDYADLQVVRFHLSSSGNLHFASKESLWSLLRVQPGAVTPLALIHTSARGVRVLIDASLVKRIDRDATKLFFHPLLAQFQVGLTLTQLEKFLSHCGVALEMLPSLVSYSSGRKYNLSTAGSRFKHMDHRESEDCSKSGEPRMEEAARESKQASSERTAMQGRQPEDGEEPYKSLFEKLGIKVDILSFSSHDTGNSFIPCRCVYLKDKRDGYFLFVCHQRQKVDFSNLKTQLKPKKKITPLDKQELLSVLNLTEDFENPFPLASVMQPRFLVAVADNLYQKNKAVLTFPHPTNSALRLKVTLKDLEVFFQGVDHDLTTIPVKGSLESLLASSAPQACSASSTLATTQNQNETEEKDIVNLASTPELVLSSDLNPSNPPATAFQRHNLFYQMTAPVRDWIIRWIGWFVRLLDRCLPGSISAKLQQSILWQRMALTDPSAAVTEHSKERLHNTEKQERTKREQEAKLSKLKQLIEESGIAVEMKNIPQTETSQSDDAKQCKTYMLQSARGRRYFFIGSEDDNPTEHLRYLRTSYRYRSVPKPASDGDIAQLLSWKEQESTISWTQEDLNPLLLLQLDLSSLGRVRVGVRACISSFPDTTIAFDLPSLGVTLQMNYDDVETKLKRHGFHIDYLP